MSLRSFSCCCCGEQEEETKSLRRAAHPLLVDLEHDFAELAGFDRQLNTEELTQVLIKCAERKSGEITEQEKKTIKAVSEKYLQVMDIDGSGKISYQEFITYMQGGQEDRGGLQDMRQELRSMLRYQPWKLGQLIRKFKKWDTSGDGYITVDELAEHLGDVRVLASDSCLKSCVEKMPQLECMLKPLLAPSMSSNREKAQALMDEMDVDGDGRADLWEVIAQTLGRRKTPVELLLYDISKGVSKHFSPVLLGQKFEAIYHSSVLVFGKEYWYGGYLFMTNPPSEAQFGKPLQKSVTNLQPSAYNKALMTVHLGYTLATKEEFKLFLTYNLAKKYTPKTYDVLANNCNHYSNDVVRFLTGQGIPDTVLKEPEMVMERPLVKLLRPFLNHWLGGFKSADAGAKGGADGLVEAGRVKGSDELRSMASQVLGEGKIVTVPVAGGRVLGCVTQVLEGTLEVKVFDPAEGQFRLQTVQKSDAKPV